MKTNKTVLKAIFVFAFICFFFPFIAVSCQGQTIKSFSGMELVTGTTVQDPLSGMNSLMGTNTKQSADDSAKVKPNTYAILALIATIIGLAASFIRQKPGAIISGVSAIVGLISAFLIKGKLMGQSTSLDAQVDKMIQVDYKVGFFLLVISLIAAAAYSFMLYKNENSNFIAYRNENNNFTQHNDGEI